MIRPLKKTLTICYLLLLSVVTSAACQAASEQEVAEYNIKAAYLYQFVNYIEWPEGTFTDDSGPIVFGVINADLLAGILEQFAMGRRVKDRAVEIRRLDQGDPLSDLHVLFVGGIESEAAELLLLDASGMPVLTVTESVSAHIAGSIINFEIVDDKVRFDVALSPAEQGNLRISSRLLQVAQRVVD